MVWIPVVPDCGHEWDMERSCHGYQRKVSQSFDFLWPFCQHENVVYKWNRFVMIVVRIHMWPCFEYPRYWGRSSQIAIEDVSNDVHQHVWGHDCVLCLSETSGSQSHRFFVICRAIKIASHEKDVAMRKCRENGKEIMPDLLSCVHMWRNTCVLIYIEYVNTTLCSVDA